ncbi:hypothetical protein C0995_008652 [Termitomyces sp. Mi166|nr:hypothetical protein C0995_008652 [Termitomyces sp. Mi166\
MGSESSAPNHLKQNRYYLPGGDIYFLVGNEIFRIHRYFLQRESPVFEKMIESPEVSGSPRTGESESTAIILDVTPAAFEKLLNVFYNPRFSVYNWSVDDWTTIIELAQKWEFPQVHDLAIRELEKMDISLISRIVLYHRLKLEGTHLLPLYGMLCKRPQALNTQECKAIGLATTVLIFNARERLRARPSDGGMSPLPDELQDDDVHATLMALLGGTAPPAPLTSR